MSIDRIANCYLGFRVDEKKLYEEKKVELDPLTNCKHEYPYKLKDKHCRECGEEIHAKKRVEVITRVKQEIINAIVKEYRNFGDNMSDDAYLISGIKYVLGKLDGHTIGLFQVEFDIHAIVVGVYLASIDSMRDGIVSEKARWVDEKRLAAFLKKKKIPIVPGTFRIHMLMEIY